MRSLFLAVACIAAMGCGGNSPTGDDGGTTDSGPRQLWNDTDAAFAGCDIPPSSWPSSLTDCESLCYERADCLEIDGRLIDPQPGETNGVQIYSLLDVCLASCK